jgi:hypothetical protein
MTSTSRGKRSWRKRDGVQPIQDGERVEDL